MGGCCGSGTKIRVNYEGHQEVFDHVADIDVLKMQIHERLQVRYFDIVIDGKLISTNEEFRPLIHSRTLIEITIKQKEPEVVPPPVKPSAEASKIQIGVPKKIKGFLYEIVDKAKKPMLSTLLLDKSYLFVHKQYVPKVPTSLSFSYEEEKLKMNPVKEFDNFLLYKLDRDDLPSMPIESCVDFTRRGKIHSNKVVPLVQDRDNFQVYHSNDTYLNSNYLGFPVFAKSTLIGFVDSVTETTATLVSAKSIVCDYIPSTIKVKRKIEPRAMMAPKISLTSINFQGSPERPVQYSEQFDIPNRKAMQEKEGDFEEEGEIIMDVNIGIALKTPDNFAYSFVSPDRLISYNSQGFGITVTKIELQVLEGATYTATPQGLMLVAGRKVWRVNGAGKEALNLLQYDHRFHAAIWHNNRMHVISGRDITKVELLDDEGNWVTGPALPVPRENSAVCSVGDFIYLAGGKEIGGLVNTVMKLDRTWEMLPWILPWRLEGMGAIYSGENFIIFGGTGKAMANNKYAVFDSRGKETSRGELPVSGVFAGKSFGFYDGVYSFMISETEILEYQNCFKLVAISL